MRCAWDGCRDVPRWRWRSGYNDRAFDLALDRLRRGSVEKEKQQAAKDNDPQREGYLDRARLEQPFHNTREHTSIFHSILSPSYKITDNEGMSIDPGRKNGQALHADLPVAIYAVID